LVFVFEFGPDIVSELGLQRQRAELELGACVEDIAVRNAREHAGNSLLSVGLVQIKVLGAAVDSLKAVRLDGSASARLDAAVGLENVGNGRSTLVRLTLKEVEEITGKRLVQGDAVLVFAVESRSLVLVDVLR
jgi:hypothetical protein